MPLRGHRNSSLLTVVLTLVFTVVTFAQQRQHEFRTWTDNSGKLKVEAALVELKGETVYLKRKDGKAFAVPLARFSEADQKYAKSGGSTQKPAKKTSQARASQPQETLVIVQRKQDDRWLDFYGVIFHAHGKWGYIAVPSNIQPLDQKGKTSQASGASETLRVVLFSGTDRQRTVTAEFASDEQPYGWNILRAPTEQLPPALPHRTAKLKDGQSFSVLGFESGTKPTIDLRKATFRGIHKSQINTVMWGELGGERVDQFAAALVFDDQKQLVGFVQKEPRRFGQRGPSNEAKMTLVRQLMDLWTPKLDHLHAEFVNWNRQSTSLRLKGAIEDHFGRIDKSFVGIKRLGKAEPRVEQLTEGWKRAASGMVATKIQRVPPLILAGMQAGLLRGFPNRIPGGEHAGMMGPAPKGMLSGPGGLGGMQAGAGGLGGSGLGGAGMQGGLGGGPGLGGMQAGNGGLGGLGAGQSGAGQGGPVLGGLGGPGVQSGSGLGGTAKGLGAQTGTQGAKSKTTQPSDEGIWKDPHPVPIEGRLRYVAQLAVVTEEGKRFFDKPIVVEPSLQGDKWWPLLDLLKMTQGTARPDLDGGILLTSAKSQAAAAALPAAQTNGNFPQPRVADGNYLKDNLKADATILRDPSKERRKIGIWADDGKAFLYTATGMNLVRRLGVPDFKAQVELFFEATILDMAMAKERLLVMTRTRQRDSTRLWGIDPRTLKVLWSRQVAPGWVTATPNQPLALVTQRGRDGYLMLLEAATGRPIHFIGGQRNWLPLAKAIVTPDGKHWFSEINGVLLRFQIDGSRLILHETTQQIAPYGATLSIDGGFLATMMSVTGMGQAVQGADHPRLPRGIYCYDPSDLSKPTSAFEIRNPGAAVLKVGPKSQHLLTIELENNFRRLLKVYSLKGQLLHQVKNVDADALYIHPQSKRLLANRKDHFAWIDLPEK